MFGPKKMSGTDLASFFRPLAIHLAAGLPPGEALQCIGDESPRRPARRLAQALHKALAAGASLDGALHGQAARFGRVIATRLNGHQSAPAVAAAAADIADFLEERGHLDQQVSYLSAWEKLTAAIAAVLVAGILIFVVPAFKLAFADFGSSMPGMTSLVVALSDLLIDYWYAFVLLWFGFRLALERSPAFARAWGNLFLKLPIVGRKQRVVGAAMVTDAALFLARHGLPTPEAVRLALGDLDNAALRTRWQACAAGLENGESWASGLAKTGVAPLSLIAHARLMKDQSAEALRPMVATHRDSATEYLLAYNGWIGRVFSISLGVVIAILVISIYLPIFRLGSVVG